MIYPPTDGCRKDDWKPVVMTALTDLGPDGSEVRFRDVLASVESGSTFPGWDAWGTTMKRGKPYPVGHRMITLAALALKSDGAIASTRRGYYRLAANAVEAVEAVEAIEVVEAVEAIEVVEVVEVVEAIPDPTILESHSLRVVPDLDPVPVATEPEPEIIEGPVTHPLYLSCERARRVAIQATACFGYHEAKSKACARCPLAGLCHAARGVAVVEAVERLEAVEAAAVAAAVEAAAVEAAAVEAAAVEVVEAATETVEAATEAEANRLPWDVTCSGCNGTVQAGTPIKHIEGRGAFHMLCE